ncbi:hypothetical protein MHBO_000044 [Bonamia ostreae]|uniref:Uncharacterized protein n=1 Tax=Bonamia ostreae TaxID=126728 RepID=A0ABV2AE90_9EUKA
MSQHNCTLNGNNFGGYCYFVALENYRFKDEESDKLEKRAEIFCENSSIANKRRFEVILLVCELPKLQNGHLNGNCTKVTDGEFCTFWCNSDFEYQKGLNGRLNCTNVEGNYTFTQIPVCVEKETNKLPMILGIVGGIVGLLAIIAGSVVFCWQKKLLCFKERVVIEDVPTGQSFFSEL